MLSVCLFPPINFSRAELIFLKLGIVAYMLEGRTVEAEEQSLLGNGCVICNNRGIIGNGM
jgi:hypothetical protein